MIKIKKYDSFLILAVTSIFLTSSVIISQDAFAMGPASCSNEYSATITNFKINNGSQTFDPTANPNVTFDAPGSYSVNETVHIANQSSQGNTDPGYYLHRANYFNFYGSACVGPFTPDQNYTRSFSISSAFGHESLTQYVTVSEGGSSVSFNVHWLATPTAPQNLIATPGNAQVSLSWTTSSSNGGSTITGYNVYRGTSSGSETLLATTGNMTSYTDNTVTNGQTYFYKVTAVNSVGESSPSNEASATPAAPATVSSAPTGLTATTVSSSQINLSWTAPSNNGGSQVTGYMIQRSTDGGATWSTITSNSGSTSTTYSDTGLAASTTYTYQVSAINSVGTSSPSNTASATTSGITIASGIILNNVQSTSGTTSSSNQMTLSGFNAGTGSNQLLLVGISANNNSPVYVTFNGMPLTQAVSSFFNNDAEFWYLKNPTGTGNIVVTMGGPTQAVVGAYSFSGVSQTLPIPTSVTGHNTTPNSPNISLTTKYPNDLVLDLPSIWGGVTLGSPTCIQQWDANVPNAITGASSSTTVQSPAAVACKWTASSADFWDDVAVEVKAN